MPRIKVPGTDRTVSAPVWAVGVAVIITTIVGQTSNFLTALAVYQERVGGCQQAVLTLFGGS